MDYRESYTTQLKELINSVTYLFYFIEKKTKKG